MNGNSFDSYKQKTSPCDFDMYLSSLTPKSEGSSHIPTQRTPSNIRQAPQTPPPPGTTPRTPPAQTPVFPPFEQQGPPPVMDYRYIAGYLNNNIGAFVKAEFIVGTNQFIDKTGRLVEVGINYFVLEEFASNHRVLCDLYSVKFVTFYDSQPTP